MGENKKQDEFLKKRAARQAKIRKRRLKVFLVFLIVLLLAVGAILCLTVFFPIENITISGSSVYSSEQIAKSDDIEIGDNLFAVSRSKTEDLLKKKLPYIEKIEFKRKLPGSLTIKVTDAEEFAIYNIENSLFLVSSSGWVMSKESEAKENLFIVSGIEAKCNVGSKIVFTNEENSEIIEKISQKFNASDFTLNEINFENSRIELRVDSRFTVDFGSALYLDEKLNHMEAMIKEIPTEKAGKINLSMWEPSNTKGTFIEEK